MSTTLNVDVRPLQPYEAGDVVDAVFAGMSDESRRRRFHVRMSRLPGYVRAELIELDGCSRAAVAAWVDGVPVGIARLGRVTSTDAEVAVAVVDAWHGHGIGRRLLTAVADLASDLGYESVSADVLSENTAMLHLLRGVFPDARTRVSRGLARVTCPLGAGGSILAEPCLAPDLKLAS